MCVVLSHLSHVRLPATLWTVACQAPLSMGILQARILEWVLQSFSLPNPGIYPASLTSPALADRFFTTRAIREVPIHLYICSETNHRALILCQTLIKEIQSHPRKNKSFILIKKHPSISTHPQVNELATWTVAGCSLFVFLAHRYSSPPTFPRHACSLLPFVFPELYFLCYCQINSISGYFKLASVYFFI